LAKQAGDQPHTTGDFGVGARVRDGTGKAGKVAEPAAVSFRQGSFSRLNRWRGLAVISLFVGGLEDVVCELNFIFGLRRGPRRQAYIEFDLQAISLALAQQSPIRIVLIDEMGRLDRENKLALVRTAQELIESGHLDQFIGVDADAAP